MADRTDHLAMLIGMMGAVSGEHDGEGVNAYRLATRELKRQGLTWRDIAERALSAPTTRSGIWQGPTPAPSPPPRRESTPTPSPTPPPPPPPEAEKPRYRGFQVPPAIGGTIRIIDHDRKGGVLLIEVEGDKVIYGPLIIYRGAVQDKLLTAHLRYATLRVRPPLKDGHMPMVVGCTSL